MSSTTNQVELLKSELQQWRDWSETLVDQDDAKSDEERRDNIDHQIELILGSD